MSAKVEAWRATATRVICEEGGSELDVPTVLALIEVESAGDEHARRPDSQFCGLLQMGRLAGIDVGYEDNGVNTTVDLLGDGEKAIRMMLRYQARYRSRTRGDGWAQAALWKGGPGTMRRVWEQIDKSRTPDEALLHAQKTVPLPALVEYVRRYRRALARYEVSCG